METMPNSDPKIDPAYAQPTDRAAAVFVWGVWATMLVTAFWFARNYGNPVPFIDEWAHTDVLSGEQDVTAEWAWRPHGEHRIPLPKLAWISVIKWTRSFKAGVYVNVLLFGIATFVLIRAAQKQCGGLTFSDAVLPLLLLHLGQGYNLQWWWQIIENLASIVICVLIASVVRGGPSLSPRAALQSGICLMILPFCGPSGLPCAVAMSIWLGVWGLRSVFRSDGARIAGVAAAGMAAASLAFVALYFVGLSKPEHMPASPSHWATLRTALQFLSVSVGSGANFWWTQKAALVCVVLVSSLLVLVAAWWRWHGHRFQIAGLLFLMLAIFPLALSLGWGRAYNGETAGLSHWYTIFGAPALCAAYFAWRLYAPPSLGRFSRAGFFAGACMMLALNLVWCRDFFGRENRRMAAFMADLNTGMVLPVLADRYSNFLFATEHASYVWAAKAKQLHQAGYPVFRPLHIPDFEQIEIPYQFKHAHDATWADPTAVCTGTDPFLIFALDKPTYVSAIQIWYSYTNAPDPVQSEFYWRHSRDSDFNETTRFSAWTQSTKPKLISRTFVIDDTIDQFRIDPANAACDFVLKRILFLTPTEKR